MTNEELAGWNEPESDFWEDSLHVHFEEFGRWDWGEIAQEGTRIYSVMFGEKVEEFSSIDNIISAVAAHANHSAYMAMAAALGVNADYLRVTVAEWGEKQDNPPPAVSPTRLLEMVEEYKVEFGSLKNSRAAVIETAMKPQNSATGCP